MKVYYLISDKLEILRERIGENIENYKSGKLKFVQANDLIRAQKMEIEHFKFDMSESKPSDTDYENIKNFYLAFKDLKDSQASEERLWAGLCHYKHFWKYLKYRWNCETENEVFIRYFFNYGARSIFWNGLARLWWYGRMTYDEKAEDPFELTRYICEGDFEGRGYLPLTFSFSNNKKIYQIYLRTLMEFEKNHKLNREEHEKIRKRINLWGGKMLLDSFSDEELAQKINDYLNEVIIKKDILNE